MSAGPFLVGCLGKGNDKFKVEKDRRLLPTELPCAGCPSRLFELLFPISETTHLPRISRATLWAVQPAMATILGKLVMDPLCTVARRGCAESACPDMGEYERMSIELSRGLGRDCAKSLEALRRCT